jgi:hypothetical protein
MSLADRGFAVFEDRAVVVAPVTCQSIEDRIGRQHPALLAGGHGRINSGFFWCVPVIALARLGGMFLSPGSRAAMSLAGEVGRQSP